MKPRNGVTQSREDMYRKQLGGTQAALNRSKQRVRDLESLLREISESECFDCHPWEDGFRCNHWDGSVCKLHAKVERMLG